MQEAAPPAEAMIRPNVDQTASNEASATEFGESSELHPFPEGWYFIARRSTVEKHRLIQRTWLGERIVVWADGNGGICVADSICPHLGSDLGPDAGGRVRNGCLVCPFHGFEYDVAGQCVATPYAPAPRNARLKVFRTREVLDLIFAWWGNGGRAPQWELPPSPDDGPEWSGMEVRSVRFAGHPQETTENSVDLGHLRYVHGYDSVDRTDRVSVDGAKFTSCFKFRRTQSVAGLKVFSYDVAAEASIHGLGYSLVKVHERTIDMNTRMWVLATPIDGRLIEMTLVSQMRQLRRPKWPLSVLRLLPLHLRTRIMNRVIILAQKHDVLQDVTVWSRKQYRERPVLCRSDGEIGKFRHYCRQFYPGNIH